MSGVLLSILIYRNLLIRRGVRLKTPKITKDMIVVNISGELLKREKRVKVIMRIILQLMWLDFRNSGWRDLSLLIRVSFLLRERGIQLITLILEN